MIPYFLSLGSVGNAHQDPYIPILGHLVEPEDNMGRTHRCPTVGPPREPGCKIMILSKMVRRPLGTAKYTVVKSNVVLIVSWIVLNR